MVPQGLNQPIRRSRAERNVLAASRAAYDCAILRNDQIKSSRVLKGFEEIV